MEDALNASVERTRISSTCSTSRYHSPKFPPLEKVKTKNTKPYYERQL